MYLYVDVEENDVLYNLDDTDLIEELESRGYIISSGDSSETSLLTNEEKDVIVELFMDYLPGTIQYEIYEKLRKR